MTDEQIRALKEPGGKSQAGLFTPEEQAILRYTDLLTTRPENIEEADLEALSAQFNEEQIIELTLAIATANWTTRINDGLQVPSTDTDADDWHVAECTRGPRHHHRHRRRVRGGESRTPQRPRGQLGSR